MTSPYIRPLTSDDYDQWRGLYQGYADFYHVALTKDGVQTTWSWLIDVEHVCSGLVVEQRGQLVGLAHFRGMPSPLRGQMIGFLDDLFVTPDHRSSGAAASLIRAVQQRVRPKAGALCVGSPVIIIIGPVACMTSWQKKLIGCYMK
jgi:Acetyltransferase (GNAT) family.